MTEDSSIKISVPDTRERKRRQRELLLALGAFLLIIVLTWVELRFLGVNSYLFLGLFNLNFILLLLVLFLVFRNVVKLILERRRRVLGARLRTRLVLLFMTLSLVPTVLMFLLSIKFVQTSVDYWFNTKVESSMQQALEVGQAFYASSRERVRHRGRIVIQEIRKREFAWGGKTMDDFLAAKFEEYGLGLIGVLSPELSEQNWHQAQPWDEAWRQAKSKIDWNKMAETPQYLSTLLPGATADLVVGVMPVDEGKTGYLILGENIGSGLLYKLDQIVRGVDEYKKIKAMKYPIKVALYMILGVMTLLIIFGSMWFGFRLAKEISAPVQALAAGTQRIAKGDLAVRLEDQSRDELGLLVQSFNRMAEDLEHSRHSLTQVNLRLAEQYEILEERGRYIEAVLNNITAGVVSLDGEGRISTINKAAVEMLALDKNGLVGKKPQDLLRGEYLMFFSGMMQQLSSTPGTQWQQQIEVGVRGRQLKLLVNVVALQAFEGESAGVVAVFEDITELEKTQRLAAWKEVARRIAHEIKNPLTPIKLSAQRLERKFGPEIEDPIFKQSTALIARQVEHLQQMVAEFSAFAKLPEIRPEFDHLAPLLEEVVATFQTSHTNIDWRLEYLSEIPGFKFDREAIRRAMINILTNAAEVMDGDGAGEVVVTASRDKKQGVVRVEVSDNGPGLSPEERSRLFEPYFSRKKGGTGLGLTIVKSIVNDHRGYVRVRPNHPKGTTIELELPLA